MPVIGTRWGICLLMAALAFNACNCGNDTQPDPDAGEQPPPPPPPQDGGPGDAGPSSLPWADFCPAVEKGYQLSRMSKDLSCGKPVTAADLVHMLDDLSVGITYREVLLGAHCNDAGLGDVMGIYQASIAAGRLEYDAVKAYECRELGRAADGGIFPVSRENKPIGACENVFVPKVELGGACQLNIECAGDAYCKASGPASCSGTCVARLGLNEGCHPDNDQCANQATCGNDGGVTVCINAKKDVGEACTTNTNCKSHLVCWGDTDKTCQLRVPLDGTCEMNITRLPDGGITGYPDNCMPSGLCVIPDGGMLEDGGFFGSCMAPAVTGEPCDPLGFDGKSICNACTRCEQGTCTEYGRTGASCVDETDCFDPQVWYCDNADTCQVRPRQGEACVASGTSSPTGNCMYADNFCQKTDPTGGVGAPGTCAPFPGLGEFCVQGYSEPYCGQGWCKTDAGSTCVDELALPGEPCTTAVWDVPYQCTAGHFCSADPNTGMGTCEPYVAAFGPCTTHEECIPGTICGDDAGFTQCVNPYGAGAACTDDSECASGYCDIVTDTCGALCSTDGQLLTVGDGNVVGGCMRYTPVDLVAYLLFAVVLLPIARRLSREKKK